MFVFPVVHFKSFIYDYFKIQIERFLETLTFIEQ